MFELGDPPDYEPDPASSIAARAAAEGRAALDLAYDLLLRDGGRSFLYLPFSTTPTAISTRSARCSRTPTR